MADSALLKSFRRTRLANTKSAQKRMRQDRRRRAHNRGQRSRIKSIVKKVLKAENAEAGTSALKEAYEVLDRLAGRNIIHRNKAARKKSQLARAVNKLG